MAIPTVALNETTPAGGAYVRDGNDRIIEYKIQVREILAIDHYFPSSGQNDACGRHKQMTLIEAADIGTGADGVPILGAQLDGAIPELVYTDQDNTDVQITKGGKLNALALGGVYPATLATMITMLALIYPIGCIYTTIVATNPATVFGFGTWVAFGAGKVLVGLNSGDADFDTAEETGGAKTTDVSHVHVAGGYTSWQGGANYGYISTTLNLASAGSATQSVMNPYIVVYMWKRTA